MTTLKVLLLFAGLLGMALAKPHPSPSLGAALSGGKAKEVSILKDHREQPDKHGNYKYDIELSDETKLQQEGATEPPGPGESEGSLVVKGSYSYIAPDGTPVHVSYIADKDGFRVINDANQKS